MSSVECHFIGPLELRIDGDAPPPELLWRKNVALLAYLACSTNRRRTRDQLVGLLWPDKTDSAARQSLREAIRVLRRHLGAAILKTEGDSVELELQDLHLDVGRFDDLALGDPNAAADLIRGEFLEGFSIPGAADFERWLATERLQWRHRSVDVLMRSATAALNTGDLRGAVNRASAALKLEPGSDAAARMAMRGLALAGHRSAALEIYEQFAVFMTDLGAAPEQETEELALRIKEQRVWSVEPPAAGLPVAVRRPPLIGRAIETLQTLELWQDCCVNKVAAVVVTEADPGIGKTRLLHEFVSRVRLDGAVVASVRGVPADCDTSGGGLLALAADGLLKSKGVRAAGPTAISALVDRVPGWADEFPGAHPDPSSVSTPHALTEVLRCVTEEEPVCICLDDAYWLDSATLDWMHAALRDLSHAPFLLWVNTAPSHPRDQIDELRKRIGHEVRGLNISLSPFDEHELGELVEQTVVAYSPPQQARLTRRLLADSGGIPLLAVELLHAVESGMELKDGTDVWPSSNQTLSQTLPSDLPEAVVSAIRVGFRVLSQNAQDTLRVVAVLGDGVKPAAIGAGATLEGVQLDKALDELEWERWLETDGRGYGFVARIVREVVLEDMVTAGQRRRIEESQH